MNTKLSGLPVREHIEKEIKNITDRLEIKGVRPKLATIRVGDSDGDKFYEGAVRKRAAKYGFDCENIVLNDNVTQEDLEAEVIKLNDDNNTDGVLLLMPFPQHINSQRVCAILDPSKDVDAVTDKSYADLFANRNAGDAFYACTAQSCMEILNYYGYKLRGKDVTIVGRSLRVGKPLMLMMMNENATVKVCHSKTREEDMLASCREADVVILATGVTEGYGGKFFRDGQIIIDVGTGKGKDGKIAGDLDIDDVERAGLSISYTPVPGGVGAVTTTILMMHVAAAAEMKNR